MEPLLPDDPRELGPYRLLRRVGSGGMGMVFLALHTGPGNEDLAAIKAVRPEFAEDPEFRARFTVEVDLARRVRGPYTARVLDADAEGPRPWLATEYVSGPDLNDAVRQSGPLPAESLRALAAGFAEALEAIHTAGLVHRDLKPSNVLLSQRGPQVIDFGIARAIDATVLTKTGQTLGTPAFMSPEQATGAPVGPSSDVFSFGGVLVFAATGRPPFGSGGPAALLYRVVNEEPDLTGVPDNLLDLVTSCLVKEPDERPGPGSLLAELSDTALPAGDAEGTTEWLPAEIASRVQEATAVVTRILPTQALPAHAPEQGIGVSMGAGGGNDDAGGESGPSDTSVEPVDTSDSAGPARAQDPEVPAVHAGGAAAGPSQSGAPGQPATASTGSRRTRPTVIWGVALSVVALVLGLGFSADQEPPSAGPGGDLDHASEDSSSTRGSGGVPPAPEESPTATGREAMPSSGSKAEVRDTVFLDGPDRFASLSPAGVDVFDSDSSEAVERLTEPEESYRFIYDDLAASHDGSTVAAKAVASSSESGQVEIHVWDLDTSERHVVPLPEEDNDGVFALSTDGALLHVGRSNEEEERLDTYETHSAERLHSTELPLNDRGHHTLLRGLGTSPDGELLIAVVNEGLLAWYAGSGEPHPDFEEVWEAPEEVSDPIAFGEGVVAAQSRDSIILWDLESDGASETIELERERADANARVRELSIGDGDGRIVATGRNTDDEHHYLTVWDREGDVLVDDSTTREYFSVDASPPGTDLLASFYTYGEASREFVSLDEDLEPGREFKVPER
ncbi:WD40 repeat domain-containing serine/threonine protein kinase [Nocardiopsis salina]|uniref:WD40 repeat domain-containing serine/threonine protein kinase n=1 Tax=Nocardiopsis salina TaxID=245836 RepID=UPI000345A5C7|nr:serine/threonine-protein kinase [Nocardiopsis salina]